VIGAAAVALIAAGLAVLFTVGESTETNSDLSAVPAPLVTGAPLPRYMAGAPDVSIGRPAPEVRGNDFELNPVGIVDDGRPKVILFLAHWCPHCQREVPEVQAWLSEGGKPEGIDFYSVVTSNDELRPNYPPDAWLRREGWSPPVVVDTNNSVARAFGLTAFPYWVFVDADGAVAGRVTGRIPVERLTELFRLLEQ
jgi:thiol-disulfide isomerase/thioredoxin